LDGGIKMELKDVIDQANLQKLRELNNPHVIRIVEESVKLCKPAKVTIINDSPEDVDYIRALAIQNGEENKLNMEGHTIHFDGFVTNEWHDQARDKKNTRVLLPEGWKMGKHINTIPREEGLKEVLNYMDGAMRGKEMIIRFITLGPTNSPFSIPALQITDSAYVCHSEDLLYRLGYEEFKRLKGSDKFFHFIHSAGELNGNVTKNLNKRRIYIDLKANRVVTVNNQYAGNSLGPKKLALRLAINWANNSDWLAEHMFVMGAHPPGKNRVTYFLGAFPSACGKTSTAMIPGQSIVGDDIAYLRIIHGEVRAVNVEKGVFGIIRDVNLKDDPIIYKTITTPREMVFSNVLIKDGVPYWLGMGRPLPKSGINYSGDWFEGKKDENGKEIKPAHPNARYTIKISDLENADPRMDDPNGVVASGVIYGGRDSDTSVPVSQALSWEHGVFIGATLESETTSATLGAEGVRKHSPMANLDFIVVPLGKYIKNHLDFGRRCNKSPLIFSTNYFIKGGDGKYLTEKVDKKVWLIWMDGRVHGEYNAIKTPVGFIPKFEDLKNLFKQIFNREFTKEEYVKLFSIRINKFLEKIDRMEKIYKEEEDIPQEFFNQLDQQRSRLQQAQQKYGDVATPDKFE
jgi:phosphoenolpyruvate carboxykinase (GTP)